MSTMQTNFTSTNMSNISFYETPTQEQWRRDLLAAYKICLPLLLVVVMFTMGCDVTLHHIKTNLRRPWAVIIGFVCQFLLLPAIAVGVAHACQLSNLQALGLLIISCCPGGTMSNVFTYYTDGDVSLSVCMTALSTAMALGMMPLNLFIYARIWTNRHTVIPFTNIAITLASILGPVVIGMLIRWKFKKAAEIILKVGSAIILLGVVAVLVINIILFPAILKLQNWKAWLAGFVLPVIGFVLGFVIARIFRRTYSHCRTVAFETGTQNAALGVTLALLSFDEKDVPTINLLSIVYGITMIIFGFAVTGVFKLYVIKRGKPKEETDSNDEKDKEKHDFDSASIPKGHVNPGYGSDSSTIL